MKSSILDLYSTKQKSMKKHVVNQARKALFGLYAKIRSLDLSIKTIWQLIGSNLTYGCEVWGFGELVRYVYFVLFFVACFIFLLFFL